MGQPDIKDFGANVGVAERRHELIERIKEAQEAKVTQSMSVNTKYATDINKDFEVLNSRTKKTTKFEWWRKEKVDSTNLIDSSAKLARESLSAESKVVLDSKIEAVKRQLREHDIRVEDFGKGDAKTIEEFGISVFNGVTRLMLDAAKYNCIVRVVDVVLLRVYTGDHGSKRFLIQTAEQYPDGRKKTSNQLPGAKKKPHENGVQAAKRIVAERLQMPNCEIDFDFTSKECFEEEEDSPHYPGVRTVYRKEIFEGVLVTTNAQTLAQVGVIGDKQLTRSDSEYYVRSFAWMNEDELEKQAVMFRAPKEGAEISALVNAPIGFDEEELLQYLTDAEVDVSQFGQDGNKTLEEFSAELIGGEASLQRRANGKMSRVVDIVLLKIVRRDGHILVEASQNVSGETKTLNRMPAVKRRTDENQFAAAHRVLKEMRVSENDVNFSEDDIFFCEEEKESRGYCGLLTVYQKRFITATLVTEADCAVGAPRVTADTIQAKPVREGLLSL